MKRENGIQIHSAEITFRTECCGFIEEHLIKTNDTIFIVGEILEVIIPDDVLTNDGYEDIEKAGTITINSLDSYHKTNRIARLSYAKPGTNPKESHQPNFLLL